MQFKDRLKQACADSPYVPDYGKGEQVAIAKRLDVSQEAVRKWFSGESEPRGARMTKLAEFLNVDESWLALGKTAGVDKTQQASMQRLAKGAVHMLAGMIHFEGGHSAFPDSADANAADVDIYAIMKGKHTALHVAAAIEVSDGIYDFIIPRNYEKVHVVGATVTAAGKVTWLDFPTAVIAANKEPHAGSFKITVRRIDTRFTVSAGKINKFEALGEII